MINVLPADDPRRKFKYRVVLLGNQVKDQDMADAIFHDLGNSPATFEAVLKDGRFKLPMLSRLTFRLTLKVLPCGRSSQGIVGRKMEAGTNSENPAPEW